MKCSRQDLPWRRSFGVFCYGNLEETVRTGNLLCVRLCQISSVWTRSLNFLFVLFSCFCFGEVMHFDMPFAIKLDTVLSLSSSKILTKIHWLIWSSQSNSLIPLRFMALFLCCRLDSMAWKWGEEQGREKEKWIPYWEIFLKYIYEGCFEMFILWSNLFFFLLRFLFIL